MSERLPPCLSDAPSRPDQPRHRPARGRPRRGRAPGAWVAVASAAAGVAALGLAGCGGDDHDDHHRPVACEQLGGMTVAATAIGLPTTGATVTRVEVVPAAGEGATAVGEHCRVLGDIHPVDPTAPAIKFQLNLPVEADWNRKTLMFGGGGYNGTIATGTGNVPAGPAGQPVPLGRGYATFGSDSGHQAGPATSRDGSFGANDEALLNFGGDALKKTRDVATAIVERRYGRKPEQRYFAGGSTGGREALIAVSRWPERTTTARSCCTRPGTRSRSTCTSGTSRARWPSPAPTRAWPSAARCSTPRCRPATASTA